MHTAGVFVSLSLAAMPLVLAFAAAAPDPTGTGAERARWGDLDVSAPRTHGALSVYLLLADGTRAAAPAREVLTLEEALEAGWARVFETSDVNQLLVENVSRRDVFIQMGDVIKGGKQDRMFTTDLLLPPGSGKVPASVNCVEQGRWSRRGNEDVEHFTSSELMVPARAMRMPAAAPKPAVENQGGVWQAVAKLQDRLEQVVDAPLRVAASPSSLQLTLENERLRDAMGAIEAAFAQAASEGRAVGYAYAIGDELYGAEVYASHELLAKLWPKLVRAMAVEAVAAVDVEGTAPSPAAAAELLAAADAARGEVVESQAGRARVRRVDSEHFVAAETRDAADEIVLHKMVLAKE